MSTCSASNDGLGSADSGTFVALRAPRVLHIVHSFDGCLTSDVASPWDHLRSIADVMHTLRQTTGVCEHALLTVGTAADANDARISNIAPMLTVPAAREKAWWRCIAPEVLAGKFDLVHVWKQGTLHRVNELGLLEGAVGQELLPANPVDMEARNTIRASLKIAQHEVAIMLVTSRPNQGDARLLAGILGVLELAKIPCVGLISDRAAHVSRAHRFNHSFHYRWETLALQGPLHAALPAADLILWDEPADLPEKPSVSPGLTAFAPSLAAQVPMIVSLAIKAGIPIVAPKTRHTHRLLGACESDLLCQAATLPDLSRPLLALARDASRRQTIGEKLSATSMLGDTQTLINAYVGALRVLTAQEALPMSTEQQDAVETNTADSSSTSLTTGAGVES
jgi:hypothetical protein